jgi:hypothetical protein
MAVPAVASLLAVAATGAWLVDATARESAEAMSRAAVAGAAETFVEVIRDASDELGATVGSLAQDGELAEAVATRDPRRILAEAGPAFHDLKLHHGITHWNYWEPEEAGTAAVFRNVIRIGTPSLRGDLAERETLARVARENALVVGLELGSTGFVLRALAPVREGHRVVGYVELGRDVNVLLAELKRRTGDDLSLVLDKNRIDPRRWASVRLARGERNDWADREDLVLVRAPSSGVTVPAGLVRPEGLPDGGVGLGVRDDGARTFAQGAFPVRDAAGLKVGAICVFRDVTELAAKGAALRSRGVLLLGLVLALGALAVGAAFEWLVALPLRRGLERAAGAPERAERDPGRN